MILRDPDASRWPSGENVIQTISGSICSPRRPRSLLPELLTELDESRRGLGKLNVWVQSPEAESQSLILASAEPDASRKPSGEKATEETQPSWPSNVWIHAFQSASTIGLVLIQSGSSVLKFFLVKLPVGANTRADT